MSHANSERVIGAGIGLASGLALGSLFQNEGGNGTLPAIGLAALGAGSAALFSERGHETR